MLDCDGILDGYQKIGIYQVLYQGYFYTFCIYFDYFYGFCCWVLLVLIYFFYYFKV